MSPFRLWLSLSIWKGIGASPKWWRTLHQLLVFTRDCSDRECVDLVQWISFNGITEIVLLHSKNSLLHRNDVMVWMASPKVMASQKRWSLVERPRPLTMDSTRFVMGSAFLISCKTLRIWHCGQGVYVSHLGRYPLHTSHLCQHVNNYRCPRLSTLITYNVCAYKHWTTNFEQLRPLAWPTLTFWASCGSWRLHLLAYTVGCPCLRLLIMKEKVYKVPPVKRTSSREPWGLLSLYPWSWVAPTSWT